MGSYVLRMPAQLYHIKPKTVQHFIVVSSMPLFPFSSMQFPLKKMYQKHLYTFKK